MPTTKRPYAQDAFRPVVRSGGRLSAQTTVLGVIVMAVLITLCGLIRLAQAVALIGEAFEDYQHGDCA